MAGHDDTCGGKIPVLAEDRGLGEDVIASNTDTEAVLLEQQLPTLRSHAVEDRGSRIRLAEEVDTWQFVDKETMGSQMVETGVCETKLLEEPRDYHSCWSCQQEPTPWS